MNRDQIIDHLRARRNHFVSKGVVHLAIFGSRARCDARADSDLDVLVEIAEGRRFSLLDLIGIEHDIGDETGVKTHAIMRRSLEPEFAARISDDVLDVF